MEIDLFVVIVAAIYGPATIGWSLFWLIRRANTKRLNKRLKRAIRRL